MDLENVKQVCQYCVMDSSAPGFVPRDDMCSFCVPTQDELSHLVALRGLLDELVVKIKNQKPSGKYDCIIGVSGGVDSSWVLVNAVRLGLRPLAVHMDNTWNTELATNNVAKLVELLEVDLHTEVMDATIYDSMVKAFIRSDVLDLEIIYDNALHRVVYDQARKHGVKYILSGFNRATEGVRMPQGWSARNKFDSKNIRHIARSNGHTGNLIPLYSNWQHLIDRYALRIRWVPFLDYLAEYRKDLAEQELERQYGFKRYAHKHFENTLTKIYQGIILPKKFGIDKRKPHLSSLIVSGQLTREKAIEELGRPPIESGLEATRETAKFLERLEMSREEFQLFLERKPRRHEEFKRDLVSRLASLRAPRSDRKAI